MTPAHLPSDAIRFRRTGAIHRGVIRVGWIERDAGEPGSPSIWLVRFTPASGLPQSTVIEGDKLRIVKQLVIKALSA